MFHDWKERAAVARNEWAMQYWSELETQIKDRLSQDEISDEVFTAVMSVCMPKRDEGHFSRVTGITSIALDRWRRSYDLPAADTRAAYVHICLTAARSSLLADRVENIISSSELLAEIFFSSQENSPQAEETSDEEIVHGLGVSVTNSDRLAEVFAMKVAEFDFGCRVTNCLKNEFIEYVGQLVNYTDEEMLRIPNLGIRSLNEIESLLSVYGVRLGMTPEQYPELGVFLAENPPHRLPEQR